MPDTAPRSKPRRIANHTNSLPTVRVTERLLREITQKAVEHFPIEKLILFGSRAWGKPNRDSDIDLLVIMKTELRPIERSARFRDVCRPKFIAMDVFVLTPREITERIKIGDPFYREILERGRVLYET